MRNDDRPSGKSNPVTPTGRQMVDQLARNSGAGLSLRRVNPGAMSEQVQDWSRGYACIPQKFVRLVGHREDRPACPLPQRAPVALKKTALPTDTPIG